MEDLIYCNDLKTRIIIEQEILEKYPKATICDASDEIHRERIEVIFNDNEEFLTDEYIKFMMTKGLFQLSLGIQFLLQDESVRIKKIMKEVEEALRKEA